jgi:hypothetical protein
MRTVTAPEFAFVSDQKRIRENDLGTGEPSLPPLAHLIGCPACRAARGLLEWNQQDLAVKAGISQLDSAPAGNRSDAPAARDPRRR